MGYPVTTRATLKSTRQANLQNSLVVLQFLGDALFSFVGLALALWLRFFTPLRQFGFAADNTDRVFSDYLPLLYLGTALLVLTFFYLQLYDARLLLRRHRALSIILKGVFFWFCVFLGTSLAFKFEPSVSRLFVLLSVLTTLATLTLWRLGYHAYLNHSDLREQLVQRVGILGWVPEAADLAAAIAQDHGHPYDVAGVITSNTSDFNASRLPLKHLGERDQLNRILQTETLDVLVVADPFLSREELLQVAALCERHYVAFKIIPSFFQIFVSNLRLQTISGVSILGIEGLPLDSLPSRMLKRAVDILGAVVGLIGSLPIMAVLAFLIRRDGPGPILFAQERVGRDGQPFRMLKLRSMVVGADQKDNESQSTLRDDPRMTRVGAFMRRNNLDELPQFWNVLIGDMSLVGPRPERSYFVQQLSGEIPHYNPRHTVRPGITGWAQVNGLRGDTSLVERVRYDLYYIENWSIWFDIQIMVLTFVRVKNAY